MTGYRKIPIECVGPKEDKDIEVIVGSGYPIKEQEKYTDSGDDKPQGLSPRGMLLKNIREGMGPPG